MSSNAAPEVRGRDVPQSVLEKARLTARDKLQPAADGDDYQDMARGSRQAVGNCRRQNGKAAPNFGAAFV